MKRLFILLSFCILFSISAVGAVRVYGLTLSQQAAIRYARTHGFGVKDNHQSFLSKLWSTVAPGVLGSAGVVAGSAVAWYTLRKKKKTFSAYYEQISQAQQRYLELVSSSEDKTQARKNFKKELTLIQEEAELNAAQKKLDQEQLTAIINKVQRMKEEVTS